MTCAKKDEPGTEPILAVSQGTHLVSAARFPARRHGLMVPKTADGRVLFAIPWHEQVVIGTTDNPVPESSTEPKALDQERAYLFEHVKKYLSVELTPVNGAEYLVRTAAAGEESRSKEYRRASRDHTILISPSKLITITGGKWTTYRRMGEDVINRAAEVGGLQPRKSRTSDMSFMAGPRGWPGCPIGSAFMAATCRSCGHWGRTVASPGLPFTRRKVCGECRRRWLARWKMCWRGGFGRCS